MSTVTGLHGRHPPRESAECSLSARHTVEDGGPSELAQQLTRRHPSGMWCFRQHLGWGYSGVCGCPIRECVRKSQPRLLCLSMPGHCRQTRHLVPRSQGKASTPSAEPKVPLLLILVHAGRAENESRDWWEKPALSLDNRQIRLRKRTPSLPASSALCPDFGSHSDVMATH